MGLRARFQEDLKEALRARDERRKAVIRMCIAAIQLAEVEHGGELDEPALVAVLQKEAKRRQETIDVVLAPLVNNINVESGDHHSLSHRGEAANENELNTMLGEMAEQALEITVAF